MLPLSSDFGFWPVVVIAAIDTSVGELHIKPAETVYMDIRPSRGGRWCRYYDMSRLRRQP
jgi:hypothetical protein